MMNESRKNEGQPDGSIDQITSLPDFYEDFRPEEIDEIFFTAFAQRDGADKRILWVVGHYKKAT